ncbi:MAG: hypothetical protein Q8P81_02035 [Nanoarchaeota archaeon]|nr:hypothetical protein [Nanoarchaeota archaeon]
MGKERILVIDGLNIFLRSYAVVPSISENGIPCGAISGFLKSLQKTIRETNPSCVVICWESGGSKRKREINSNYKEGRKPVRLNRFMRDQLSPQEESENKIWQLSRLTEYLEDLPVYQLLYDNVEGDDLIAFVAQLERFISYEKIIFSSDKDFIQLLDNKTILCRPLNKGIVEVLNVKSVVKKYAIHPNNFCLARSLAGDSSDNIKGVEGVGLKTVAKRLPFLMEEKIHYIDDVKSHCEKEIENKTKVKFYIDVNDNMKMIKENYSLMQLSSPRFSVQDKEKIKHSFENDKLEFKQASFQRKLIKDEIAVDFSFEELYTWGRRTVANEKI